MQGSAILAIDGKLVPGLVTAPHAELGLFLFLPDEPEAFEGQVEEGATVRIRWGDRESFDAEAEIVEIEDLERWVMSVPQTLGPTQQRQSPRVLADGAWTFETEDELALDVYDLSARGIGLEFPAGDGPSEAGTRIPGVLRSPGLGGFRGRMECTNVRAHPDDEHLWIVGGRLVITDPDARARYQELLSRMAP
jgi:hypothetical protein